MGKFRDFINKFQKKNIPLSNARSLSAMFPQLFATTDNYTSFAYACINVRANNIGQADVLVQKYMGSKWREITNNYDYVYNFFQRRNIYDQTINDLIKLASISLDLKGVAYWQIIRDGIGTPQQFIPLPSYLLPIMNFQQTDIEHYELRLKGQVIYFNKEDILTFKLPVIDNPFAFKATVDAIPDQMAIDRLQTAFQKNYLNNNARIDGYLFSENGLNESQRETLKTEWSNKYGGNLNAGKTPVLDGGLKYEQLQSTVKEMDFINSRNSIRDEILTIFNTPKSVLGITDDVNRANALATISGYLENNIVPFSMNISNKLTSFVKTNFRENLRVIFDFESKQDPQVLINQNKMLAEQGAITINELREQYNYDEVQGYDELGKKEPAKEEKEDNSNNDNNNDGK